MRRKEEQILFAARGASEHTRNVDRQREWVKEEGFQQDWMGKPPAR